MSLSEYKQKQMLHEDQEWSRYNLQIQQHSPVQQFYAEYEYETAFGLLRSSTSLSNLRNMLVCGVGGGADLQFWVAHCTALRNVTCLDFSIEALHATERRIRLNNLPGTFTYINADFEHLPFFDKSFDLVVCVHSLHHALEPDRGFKEMWRVARRAAVIVEPLSSPTTKLFVHLGIAKDEEDVGNKVIRFTVRDFSQWIGTAYSTFKAKTLFSYYHPFIYHKVLRVFDSRIGLSVFKVVYRMSNYLLFPIRSKLVAVFLKEA